MKTYKATMSVLYKPTFEIKADSMQEAERIANKLSPESIDNACYTQSHVMVIGVEVSEEAVDNRTLEEVKVALERITRQYLGLVDEFAQYRRESVKWSVEDFLDYDHPTHDITPENSQIALEYMIRRHDCSRGLSWDDVAYHIETFGTRK